MDNNDLNILTVAATPPVIQPNDNLATQERDRQFNDNVRGESYKKHIHYLVLIFIYIIAVIYSILVIVRMYDFVAPIGKYRWLTDAQDHDIERIIFSGIILSFASKYFKKYNVFE